MSRSYKHTAVFSLKNDGYFKRLAHTRNRMRERQGVYLSSRQVKHLVDSYDICDWHHFVGCKDRLYNIALRK